MDRAPYPPTEIELDIGDGTYRCRLNLPQIAELQTKCGMPVRHPTFGETVRPTGIGEITSRVLKGRYQVMGGPAFGEPAEAEFHALDCLETVRLALIGGAGGLVNGEAVKVDSIRARQIVETYVQPMPWERIWTLAAAILLANMHGYTPPAGEAAPDPKKEQPATTTSTSTSPAH